MHRVNALAIPAKSRRWPLIVVGLLVGHILLMSAAVVLATRNNHDTLLIDRGQNRTAVGNTLAPGSRP